MRNQQNLFELFASLRLAFGRTELLG